ncbi:MAG: glycosyl hydrolase family 8 [Ferruginibacter sp.]
MKSRLLIIAMFICSYALSQKSLRPFPQHSKYFDGVVIPNHISQGELDSNVSSFYSQWKKVYIKKNACSDSYYVWAENAGKNHQCVSEGQGYGMIIVALMAGYDTIAQNIFDGLFKYYKEHPSKRNRYLMSWAQSKECFKFEESSAADGDIDIAFSLLLANTQWTSSGRINYLQEASKIIDAIKEQEINKKTLNILQSNSIENDSKDYFDMRTSDFIPSEIRAFLFRDSMTWRKVLDKNYKLFDYLQKTYSKGIGLVPDFVQNIDTKPKPAKKFYLESKYDGVYNYNACRVPWRIATDYIVNGEAFAKQFVEPINKWIRETTENNPDNISAGYTLAGDDLKTRNFEALSFISSFSISAMVDRKNQAWLNKLWEYIVNFKLKEFDYYDNSIKMLTLIILSHNYWMPKT